MSKGRRKGSSLGPADAVRAYAMCRMKDTVDGITYEKIGTAFGVSRQQATDTIHNFREYSREQTELLDRLVNGTDLEKEAAEVILRLMFQLKNYGEELLREKTMEAA